MARWELATHHYIRTAVGADWEHNETDLVTGRNNRRRYAVPEYLEKGTIVCQGKPQRGDVEFIGDPTPDMIPLDDEAEAISESWREHWAYKPDNVAGDYSQSLVAGLADKFTQPVKIEGLEELVSAVAANTKQNQELVTSLAQRRL